MFYYAHINDSNIVEGVSQINLEVDAPNMIRINEYNIELIRHVYNRKTNKFSPPPETVLFQLELNKIEQALRQKLDEKDFLARLAAEMPNKNMKITPLSETVDEDLNSHLWPSSYAYAKTPIQELILRREEIIRVLKGDENYDSTTI